MLNLIVYCKRATICGKNPAPKTGDHAGFENASMVNIINIMVN